MSDIGRLLQRASRHASSLQAVQWTPLAMASCHQAHAHNHSLIYCHRARAACVFDSAPEHNCQQQDEGWGLSLHAGHACLVSCSNSKRRHNEVPDPCCCVSRVCSILLGLFCVWFISVRLPSIVCSLSGMCVLSRRLQPSRS